MLFVAFKKGEYGNCEQMQILWTMFMKAIKRCYSHQRALYLINIAIDAKDGKRSIQESSNPDDGYNLWMGVLVNFTKFNYDNLDWPSWGHCMNL